MEKAPGGKDPFDEAAIATGIVQGRFPEEDQALMAHIEKAGAAIFRTLSEEEQRGIKHPTNRKAPTYVAAFLYKHSKIPLSPFAAITAAQRFVSPTTRRGRARGQNKSWKA